MRYARCLALVWVLVLLAGVVAEAAVEKTETGALVLNAQKRVASDEDAGAYLIVPERLEWAPQATAIIICDMWSSHWCRGATERVGQMAPLMNKVVGMARAEGVTVIHAPSGNMGYYANHPARKRTQNAPAASNTPEGMNDWRGELEQEKGATWPVDQADGGCDCEPMCKQGNCGDHQIDVIEIKDEDYISDSGSETWNIMEADGIKNVILMGVHTNMCVIGRPFGLRQMARVGKNVVLMRDLTDTMYNHRSKPFVNHFTGTDLVVEYIEKHVCPTVTSSAFTGQAAFVFPADKRLRAAFITAENEYRANQRLPEWAHDLAMQYDIACDFALGLAKEAGPKRHNIAGLECLENADVAVLFVRRRALRTDQMQYLRDYLGRGRPLVGIRTASHAFDPKGQAPPGTVFKTVGGVPQSLVDWPAFDHEVLGGNYQGHYGHNPKGTDVHLVPGMGRHAILKGFPADGFNSPNWLYKNTPLSPTAQVLLTGTIPGEAPEPLLWTNRYKESRIVYTSLGHWDDWEIPAFRGMVTSALFWAMDMPKPEARQ